MPANTQHVLTMPFLGNKTVDLCHGSRYSQKAILLLPKRQKHRLRGNVLKLCQNPHRISREAQSARQMDQANSGMEQKLGGASESMLKGT